MNERNVYGGKTINLVLADVYMYAGIFFFFLT